MQLERERLSKDGVVGLGFSGRVVTLCDEFIHRLWANSDLTVYYLRGDQGPYFVELKRFRAARVEAEQGARNGELQRSQDSERAYVKKTGSRLLTKNGAIRRDRTGLPTLGLTVKNVSPKAIDAFQARIYCYGRHGKEVGRYWRQDNVIRGQA